ncbi:VUT family protein [Sodalis endosymbiont of Spalangia cameroni]|uniref:VUT family protein n=1 Tax=Sodalis praecaptivus TaxID=1239307 RepID=UPI0031F783DD
MSSYKLYGLFVGLTVTIMITCDTLVYKTLDIYGFKITASGIVFSLCFLFSTILTEVYGYKLGSRAVWIMVFCQTVYVIILNLAAITQIENNDISRNYYSLYHEFWRVMIGTWVSVPVSYFLNGFVISKMKMLFMGRLFFVRYVTASMITQAALLLTAYPISLSSKYSVNELVNIIITTWSYKVIISVFLLPVAMYLAHKVKRIEGTDHYDWGASFNPLSVFSEVKTSQEENKK